MKKKLILLIITIMLTSLGDSFCQTIREHKINNISSINSVENMLIDSLYFSKEKLAWGKIFQTNNKISLAYSFVGSEQIISTLSSNTLFRKWKRKEIHYGNIENHVYYSGIIPVVNKKESFPIFMFYGDSTLNYTSMRGADLRWVGNRKLSVMLGSRNSVIGLISDNSKIYSLIVDTEDKFGNNSVLGFISENGGYSWGSPSIVVKNNLHSLKAWTIACKTNIPESGYMTFTDKNNSPYYSHTGDAGKTWSYPKRLNSVQSGDNYKMIIYREYVMVIYRNKEKGDDYNDIMLWHGTMPEYISDYVRGDLMKIVDNDSYDTTSNYEIEDIKSYRRKKSFILLKKYDGENSTLQLRMVKM